MIGYVPRDSFEKRSKMLKQYYFECKCKLCELDSKDPNLRKREKLAEQQNGTLNQKLRIGRDLNINDAKEYLAVMRSLYEGKSQRDEALKLDLWHPMAMVAEFYDRMGESERASEAYIEVHNLIKNTSNENNAVISLIKAIDAYRFENMYGKAKEVGQLTVDTFIGDKEDIKYSLLKQFANDKDFSQIFESL
jgi:hypothetical protein